MAAKEVNRRLSDEVVSTHPIVDNLGRTPQALFVNKDRLYDVMLNNRKVKSQLDEDVTLSYPLKTPGGTQQVTFVPEAGMYTVILDSDSPLAKPIQRGLGIIVSSMFSTCQ